MTTGQLARSGAFMRAVRLLRRGWTYPEVLINLRREFVVGTDLQYHTIIRLAERGIAAANLLMDPLGPGVVDETMIPKLPR